MNAICSLRRHTGAERPVGALPNINEFSGPPKIHNGHMGDAKWGLFLFLVVIAIREFPARPAKYLYFRDTPVSGLLCAVCCDGVGVRSSFPSASHRRGDFSASSFVVSKVQSRALGKARCHRDALTRAAN